MPAGATSADFEETAPERSAKAWQAFSARVLLCRFLAYAASHLPDSNRGRWAGQEVFDEQLQTVERLQNRCGLQYEWLNYARAWFRDLPQLRTPASDDGESAVDSESE